MISAKKDEKQNQTPTKYYGKKTYLVHPLLAQLPEHKTANYHSENITEKRPNNGDV